LYQLAAAQNLDEGQYMLGYMYCNGNGVAQDFAEALRLFQLAAAQGHPYALFMVAECHEKGRGVRENNAEAIRWYRRAQEAGCLLAADAVRRLRA
jgi:TPR repeat protein